MDTELKRLTFTVTEEIGPLLDRTKKNFFYDRNRSDMIRKLIVAGLNTLDGGAEGDNRSIRVF